MATILLFSTSKRGKRKVILGIIFSFSDIIFSLSTSKGGMKKVILGIVLSHIILCLSTSKRARSAAGLVCGAGRRSSSSMRPPAGTGETMNPIQSRLCFISSGISWEVGCGGDRGGCCNPPPHTQPLALL